MDIRLVNLADLPHSVTAPTPETLCVLITYRRIVNYCKVGKDMVPVYGGAIASYPKEMGFRLNRSDLLPNCI